AGAELVEPIWGDETLLLSRFQLAGRDTLTSYSRWLPNALVEHVERGGATLSIYANDPDLLASQPTDLVGALQQAVSRDVVPFRQLISRNATNWAVIAAAGDAWAAKVFPDAPTNERCDRLWQTIARLCRLDRPDPVAAWQDHLKALAERSEYLNAKRYSALRFRGQSTSRNNIPFVANIPTEEVFTLADRARVDGTVRATKPLSYGGSLIEGFS